MTHYNSNGYVDYVEDPAGNRTSYTYDSMGRRLSQTDPLTNITYTSYTSYGKPEKIWGSAKYPVQYEYDSYGRMTKMHTYRSGSGWDQSTWPASPGDSDETTWAYHEASGLLTSKTDDAGEAVTYTYGTGGRLATRTWARTSGTNAIVTTYSYDSDTGEMTGIDYSDDTPDITFSYDRMGRQVTITDAVGTRTFAYNSALQLSTETIVSTAGATNLLTRSYDAQGRSTGFSLDSGYQVEYSYDTYGRFSSLSNFASSASFVVNYSYLSSSDLLSGYTAGDLSVTRSYESDRNLISSIENKFDATTISKYTYANDAGGRRTSVKTTGTAFMTVGDMFNLYNYNTRSELIGANRYFGDDLEDTGDPVGLQSFGYAYDNIGNRTSVTNSGDVTSYSPNNLNQYTQRQISEMINLRGSAETGATVTVKMGSSQSESVTRQNKYWHKQLTSTNDSESQYPLIKVVGVAKNAATNGDDIVTIETGHVFVAKTPEQFTYDEDGNLLSDGRWEYTWNGENRLISMETATNKVGTTVPVVRLEFVYDYQGRRVSKSVSQWVSNQWDESSSSTFVYDSWNLISETTVNRELGTTNVSSYTWGLDLSGSLQGAGGIGGLLFRSDGGTSSVSSVSYVFDANGNVSEIIDSEGTIAAHYEYDPYGNTLVSEGELASDNVYRFSTKYTDAETKLLYYGFRYYSPELGRWPSRDPIGESGFSVCYSFNRKTPAIFVVSELMGKMGALQHAVGTHVIRSRSLWSQDGFIQMAIASELWAVDPVFDHEWAYQMRAVVARCLLFCDNKPTSGFDILGMFYVAEYHCTLVATTPSWIPHMVLCDGSCMRGPHIGPAPRAITERITSCVVCPPYWPTFRTGV